MGGASTVAGSMDASEATQALGELARHGWLRPIHRTPDIDLSELQKRGLGEAANFLGGNVSALPAASRPLTRAEGALLILAARSQSSPATAPR